MCILSCFDYSIFNEIKHPRYGIRGPVSTPAKRSYFKISKELGAVSSVRPFALIFQDLILNRYPCSMFSANASRCLITCVRKLNEGRPVGDAMMFDGFCNFKNDIENGFRWPHTLATESLMNMITAKKGTTHRTGNKKWRL